MAPDDGLTMRPGNGRPIPDPTSLTTAALNREIASLQELLEARFTSEHKTLSNIVEERHREILGLRELLEARMDGESRIVTQRFDLGEAQRVEQKTDTETAITAAMAAQEKAVREQTIASERAIAKSEQGMKEQLQQLRTLFDTSLNALTAALDDVKNRQSTTESDVRSIGSEKRGGKDATAALIALAGFILTVLLIGGFALASKGGP